MDARERRRCIVGKPEFEPELLTGSEPERARAPKPSINNKRSHRVVQTADTTPNPRFKETGGTPTPTPTADAPPVDPETATPTPSSGEAVAMPRPIRKDIANTTHKLASNGPTKEAPSPAELERRKADQLAKLKAMQEAQHAAKRGNGAA
jgi:hypothetical protein